jgi:hypothetical protein
MDEQEASMTYPVPGKQDHVVAIAAPGAGPQQWAGGPSAVRLDDGSWVLAWRIRSGRDAVMISRSDDGERFEDVVRIENEDLGSSMTERPSLHLLPNGRWRMYTSVASQGHSFWKIGMIEADSLQGLKGTNHRIVIDCLPDGWPKDPVIRFDGDCWHGWTCHHVPDADGEWDGMISTYRQSDDGITWSDPVTILRPREGTWDARGVRVTTVFPDGAIAYDGRRNAAENWFERTGFAVPAGDGLTFHSISEDGESTARYLDAVALPDGGYRLFYEQVLPDESHELRTELVPHR